MPTNVGAKYANAISQRLDGIVKGIDVFRDVGCCCAEVAIDDRVQNVLEVGELLGWADAATMMRLQLKEGIFGGGLRRKRVVQEDRGRVGVDDAFRLGKESIRRPNGRPLLWTSELSSWALTGARWKVYSLSSCKSVNHEVRLRIEQVSVTTKYWPSKGEKGG